MKRRKFIQYGMLGSAACLSNLAFLHQHSSTAIMSADMNNKQSYDWIFLYWMPYDNDLSRFGTPIINMIAKGVQSENILVVVESDFWNAPKLSRSVITKGKIATQVLNTANSASEEVFTDYLNWAQSQFEAERWAIVVLGHGGHLDAISPDENPGSGLVGTQWMNIKKLSDAIASFNQKINDRIELFFFQNCNKGTIEVHYTLHKAAKYTLSSQDLLGAPNYYYESLFRYIGNHPQLDGEQLAQKIRDFEASNMYYSYTVTNNYLFSQIPKKLNSFIDSILGTNIKSINLDKNQKYGYWDEQYIDLVEVFQAITEQSGAEPESYQKFIEFLNSSMLHLVNPTKKPKNLSGLGLFFPSSRKQLDKYRYLPIYSKTKLSKLFDAILFN